VQLDFALLLQDKEAFAAIRGDIFEMSSYGQTIFASCTRGKSALLDGLHERTFHERSMLPFCEIAKF
jgi:hypothetical protein